jgi:hypothetical protein
VSSRRIKRALAIGVAGALAMNTATPLYAQLLDGEAMGRSRPSDPTPPDTFLVSGALSGNLPVSRVFSSRNEVADGRRSAADAYAMPRLDDAARNNNKGPDDYFAPRYRNGKCVEDEGNTLMAAPTFGSGVRRMEGRSLERALALLCRAAALQR